MIVLAYLFILLPALYAWAILNPMAARTFVAELMRRRRRYLIRRYGRQSAKHLFHEFHRLALRQGIDATLVESVMQEYGPFVIERLGTQVADARLGKTTLLERYF